MTETRKLEKILAAAEQGLGDAMMACGNGGSAPTRRLEEMLTEAAEFKKRFEARKAFTDAGFNLHSQCDPCSHCGHVRRQEGRTVFICGCFYGELLKHVEVVRNPFLSVMGIEIVIEESESTND